MSDAVNSEPHGGAHDIKAEEAAYSQVDHAKDLDEKAAFAEYKAGAIEAENAEHNMTVLEAVRAYPMASFWAFIMSFTIVR